MKQVNLNLNGLKGIVSRLQSNDTQAEKAVEKVVEQAVEKAVGKAKNPEEVKSLINTDLRFDTIEISVKRGKVEASATPSNPKSIGNNTQGVDLKTNIQVSFGTLTSQNVDKMALSGGIDLPVTSEQRIAYWNEHVENMSYEQKLNWMQLIIEAAEHEANAIGEGNEGYQAAIDKANEWRCYKFIMRNNYRQQIYEEIRQKLQQGISYEQLLSTPEYLEFIDLNVDISRYFSGEDEEDFRTTNPIRDENGNIIGYEYDNQGFQYFGGVTVNVGTEENPIYEYHLNNDEPGDTRQRFLYNEAMIASLKVKILAIQVKLHDPNLSNTNDPVAVKAKQVLNNNLRDYQRIMSDLLAEQKNLAVELDYMNQNETEWGTLTYTWVDPEHGLISGLTPPENQVQTGTEFVPPEDYTALCVNYKGNPDKNKLMELIQFVNNKLRDCQNKQERAYWQTELARWQTILNSWGNTTAAGNSSRPPVGNGGRGTSPNPTASKVVQTPINIFASQVSANNNSEMGEINVLGSFKEVSSVTHTNNYVELNNIQPFGTEMETSYDALVAGWDSFVTNLHQEPEAYNAKLNMINNIINLAEQAGKTDEADMWRCQRFILIQHYTAALLQAHNYQIENSSNSVYTRYPLADLVNNPLVINGFEFSVSNFPNPSIISYVNNSWRPFNSCCYSPEDNTAVESFHGDLNMHGAGYLPNENPAKEYLYDTSMIAYHSARVRAINARIEEFKHSADYQPGNAQCENYINQLRNWINTSYREIQRFHSIINNFENIYSSTQYNNGQGYTAQEINEIISGLSISGLSPVIPEVETPLPSEQIPTGGRSLIDFYGSLIEKYEIMYGEVPQEVESSNISLLGTGTDTVQYTSHDEAQYIARLNGEGISSEEHQLLLLIISSMRLGNRVAVEYWLNKLADLDAQNGQ